MARCGGSIGGLGDVLLVLITKFFSSFQRPAWTTGTLIPCSFLCGIVAAVLIWRGGQKTKRVARIEERLRAALIAEMPPQVLNNEKPSTSNQRSPSTSRKNKTAQPNENELRIDEYMTVPR